MKKLIAIVSLLTISIIPSQVSANDDITQDSFLELLKHNYENIKTPRLGDTWTTTTFFDDDCPHREITRNQVIKSVHEGAYILEETIAVGSEACTRGFSEVRIKYESTNSFNEFSTGASQSNYSVKDLGENKFQLAMGRGKAILDLSAPFYRTRVKFDTPRYHESIEYNGVSKIDLKNEDIKICVLVPTGTIHEGRSYLCDEKNPYEFLDL
jgi:hypothetical protein